MDPDILLAFYRATVLHCGKEAPVSERFQQQLIQARVLRGSDEHHIDRAIGVNREPGEGDRLIGELAQIVWKHG